MRVFSISIAALFLLAGCASTQPVADRPQYVDAALGPAGGYVVPKDDDAPPPSFLMRSWDSFDAGFGKFCYAVANVPVRIWKFFHRESPGVAARMMEDPNSADTRREGINKLVVYSFAQHAPFTTRYRQISLYDPEPTVRAIAIRASNRCRDGGATSVWVHGLNDKSELVRLEAAKALVHIPDPDAVEPLLSLLADPDENRDVRIAAADALCRYRTLRVARALSSAVGERDFGIAWQARHSLRFLTGRDYRYDEAAWLAYFTGPDKPFD